MDLGLDGGGAGGGGGGGGAVKDTLKVSFISTTKLHTKQADGNGRGLAGTREGAGEALGATG